MAKRLVIDYGTDTLIDLDAPRENLGQRFNLGGLVRKNKAMGDAATLDSPLQYINPMMDTGNKNIIGGGGMFLPSALGTAWGVNKAINYLKDDKEPPKKLWDRTGTNLKPKKPKKEPPKKFTLM